MTEKQLFELDFTGMETFEPYTGDGHGNLLFEGYYAVVIDQTTPGLTAPGKDGTVKGKVKVGMRVTDEDSEGVHLLDDVLYSGRDAQGNPLVRQFCSLLASAGTPIADIQGLGASKRKLDIKDVCANLIGKKAYIEVGFELYQGELKTKVKNWVAPEQYAKKVEAKALRGRSAEQVAAVLLATAGAKAGGRAALNGGHAVNLGGPAASSALAAPTL